MYKIILVDDDRSFLDRFYKLIDWDVYGFEVVKLLHDGTDALEYISENRIDAVITDIRMPEMSGIDLACHIATSYSDIKVVFFSAFHDFRYATEAIQYDVVGYITKPIRLDQLKNTLKKLYDKLEEDRAYVVGEILDTKIIEKRRDVFCRWIEGKQRHSEFLKAELDNVQILYQAVHSQCALAVFDIDGIDARIEDDWKSDKKNLYDAITKVVCVDTQSFYTAQLSFFDTKMVVLYINKRGGVPSKNWTGIAADDLWEIFNMEIARCEFLVFKSMKELKQAYELQENASLKYLRDTLEKRNDNKMLDIVKNYVKEHYTEDIDLETIAKQCHFNYKYFSTLFKEMMGEKFVDYLNRIRVEKAKELLANEEGTIEEIYTSVGYNNKQHFYRAFSYHTGDTPAQYRKKMLEAKR